MTRTARITAAVTATTPLLARAALQAADQLTVATYLRAQGIHPQWIKRWGSALGRKATAAYRAANDGNEPRQIIERGREVAAYDTTEYLDAAMAHYRKHKKAGPHLAAGYDRKYAATKTPRDARGRFVRLLTVTWISPAGRQARRKLTTDQAAELLSTLARVDCVTALTVRDARGRDYALAA